ncbi:hypothetical protein [Pseudoxanthomonas sp. USHLN014]|uniref:hypothetical protein n=1 Tax=Pseudoxanthomonas sp. USHLN014 TaxID=3081297 RepID=UPI00301DCACF
MSLSRVQRDAMAHAMRGDWALADALEVSCRTDFEGHPCIGGIRQGGRLQMLAFGQDCNCGLEEQCECCETGGVDIEVIVHLKGHVVWEDRSGGESPPYGIDLPLAVACLVVSEHQKSILTPTQQTLIPEAA